jgi:ribosome-associated heat shock protein Hsp15
MEEAAPRLDRWLWFARLTGSRAEAQALCAEGCVRLNGATVGRGQRRVRVGDRIAVFRDPVWRFVTVCGFSPRRLSAAAAESLYTESQPPHRLSPGDDRPTPRIPDATAPTGSPARLREACSVSDFFD